MRQREPLRTEVLGEPVIEPDAWQRPEALTRPVQPGTTAALRQERDAHFRAQSRAVGSQELLARHLKDLAVADAFIEQQQCSPWATALMQESVERRHNVIMELGDNYVRDGSGITEESVTAVRQTRRY
jgi:hypothetical protein